MSRANCIDTPDLMFDLTRVPAAMALCSDCPLSAECKALGETATAGVWAGELKVPDDNVLSKVVPLRALWNMPWRQIASVTGIPRSTAQSAYAAYTDGEV